MVASIGGGFGRWRLTPHGGGCRSEMQTSRIGSLCEIAAGRQQKQGHHTSIVEGSLLGVTVAVLLELENIGEQARQKLENKLIRPSVPCTGPSFGVMFTSNCLVS